MDRTSMCFKMVMMMTMLLLCPMVIARLEAPTCMPLLAGGAVMVRGHVRVRVLPGPLCSCPRRCIMALSLVHVMPAAEPGPWGLGRLALNSEWE